jgi:hypothetical protein
MRSNLMSTPQPNDELDRVLRELFDSFAKTMARYNGFEDETTPEARQTRALVEEYAAVLTGIVPRLSAARGGLASDMKQALHAWLVAEEPSPEAAIEEES